MKNIYWFVLLIGLMLLHLPVGMLAQSTVLSLPHAEYFDSPSIPEGWTQQHSGGVMVNNWSVVNQNQAGGSPYEMKASSLPAFGTSRLVSPPILTNGIESILLVFRHFMSDYTFGATFRIQSSTDGINWTNGNWVRHSGYGSLGPGQVSTVISTLLQDTTYLAFTIEGDHYHFYAWYIDEINLNFLTQIPNCTSIIYPVTGAQSVLTNFKLQWDEAVNAYDYLVYLGTDNPPSNLLNGASSGGITEMQVNSLQPGTQYYWSVVPLNALGQPPSCPISTFQTIGAYTLPFEEHFDAATLPVDWIVEDSACFPGWYIAQNNAAGGQENELEFDFQASYGRSRFISPPLQTQGQGIINLSFNHLYFDDFPGLTLRIQSSADAVHWTDEAFSHQSGNGDLGPGLLQTTITHNLGGIMYFSFVLEGDLSAFYWWVIDDILVEAGGQAYGAIDGQIQYDNAGLSPLPVVKVYLLNSAQLVVDSALSSQSGAFAFINLLAGSYTIQYQTIAPWGGGNAVDALLIMKHFVNLSLLSGIRLDAADLDGSAFPNAVDALQVMRRFVGLINQFPVPDWKFEKPPITIIANETLQLNIKGICSGDVDGSYVP